MTNMKKLSFAFLGSLFLSASALSSDLYQNPPEEGFKKSIRSAIEEGIQGDAHALFKLDENKKRANYSCIVKESDSFKELSLLGECTRYRDGVYLIRPDEQKAWDLIKGNYSTLLYDKVLSKPRDMTNDIYGNNEYLVFTMGDPTIYVVQARQSSMMGEFVKKLNTKQ